MALLFCNIYRRKVDANLIEKVYAEMSYACLQASQAVL